MGVNIEAKSAMIRMRSKRVRCNRIRGLEEAELPAAEAAAAMLGKQKHGARGLESGG